MGQRSKVVAVVVAGLALLAVGSAWAVPIPIGPPVVGPGDGLNVRWVDTDYGPHNADEAEAALALGPGDLGYVGEVTGVVPYIDFADDYGRFGAFVPTTLPDPLTPDDDFAVRFSGYINITDGGTYGFASYTDDGFRLRIGGEVVSEHFLDRPAGFTFADVFLSPGFYTFDFVGWEQGEAFVDEFHIYRPDLYLPGTPGHEIFFTTPEPGTLGLLGLALAGLAVWKRRVR